MESVSLTGSWPEKCNDWRELSADPRSGTSCQICSSTGTLMKSKSRKRKSTKPPLKTNKTPLLPTGTKTSKPSKLGKVKPLTTRQHKSKTGLLNKLKTGLPRPLVVTKTGLRLMPDKVGKLLTCNFQ